MDFYTFGLSLDPHAVQQRHILDDESDEEQDAETPSADPQLQITPEWSVPQIRLLLSAVGEEAAIFVKTHILPPDLKPVSHMTCNQSDVMFERASGPHDHNISELYTFNDVGVCLHTRSLKQQFVTAWSQKLMSTMKPKQVVSLTSVLHYEYITADPSSVVMPYARCLRTGHFKQDTGVPLLEPPNFIKGEAAALLTYCEVHCLPGYLQVHYTSKLDLSAIQSFKSVPMKLFGIEVAFIEAATRDVVLAQVLQPPEEKIRRLLPKESRSMLYT